MEESDLELTYRQYLLDFMKNNFDYMIESEILSFDEFKEKLGRNQKWISNV